MLDVYIHTKSEIFEVDSLQNTFIIKVICTRSFIFQSCNFQIMAFMFSSLHLYIKYNSLITISSNRSDRTGGRRDVVVILSILYCTFHVYNTKWVNIT